MAGQLRDSDIILKKYYLMFIGNEFVGKTQIISTITDNLFDSSYNPTFGIDYFGKFIIFGDHTAKLHIWDSSGHERFTSLLPNFIIRSDVSVIIFDITNKKSFMDSDKWFQEVKIYNKSNAFIFCVGNKSDKGEEREVTFDEAVIKAKLYNAIYIETSAKTGDNINQLFELILGIQYGDRSYTIFRKDKIF